jgi:signal transduction histidine kinase
MSDRLSRELHVFHELARVVAAGPYRVDEVLDGICTEVRKAFGFDRALLVRYDREKETVHAVVQQGVDWPGETWLPLDMFPFLRRAAEEGRTVYVDDPLAEDAMPRTIVERFGVRSLIAVPLSVENRCLGFLVLDRSGGEFELTESDSELLTALGCVAAVLIEKADHYAELQRAMEELQSLDEAKRDFISIASHELRTPIAVVHGVASTLHLRGDELASDQLQDLRQTLYEQTSRLAELAGQLLDLSRFEAGVVVPEHERFLPRQRIEELLLRIVPERIPDCRVEVDPRLEIVTDPLAFERVVANLVTNALRYGAPPVVVCAETEDGFRLVVEDAGEGVEPAFVPRLFERFSRSESARRHAAGAGLGLSIAQSFAQALGGALTYESGRPRGARFTLELPRQVLAA